MRVAVIDAAPTLPDYTLADFLGAFGGAPQVAPVSKSVVTQPPNGPSLNAILAGQAHCSVQSFNLQEVEDMLRYIEPFADRGIWFRVGGAIADEFGEAGRDLFLRWSRGDLWGSRI